MTGLDTLPVFMAPVVRYERPAFNPADLLPEMAVVVVRRMSSGRVRGVCSAKVISKARVWITVEEVGRTDPGQPRRWRFRLDDQTDGSQSHYAERFRTLAQQEYEVTFQAAYEFLEGQGIRLNQSSPWNHDRIKLARLLWPGRKGEQA